MRRPPDDSVRPAAACKSRRAAGVKPAPRGEHIVMLRNGKELPLARNLREIQQRLEFLFTCRALAGHRKSVE